MKWIITNDLISKQHPDMKDAKGTASRNYKDGDVANLPYDFRMKDDDGEIYFEGKSDDRTTEAAFRPLDNYGEPAAGCTTIEYKNDKGIWEQL